MFIIGRLYKAIINGKIISTISYEILIILYDTHKKLLQLSKAHPNHLVYFVIQRKTVDPG